MATRTTDKRKKLDAIVGQLRIAASTEVVVGVLAGEKNGDGASIAEYAAFNEFGTDRAPARPAMGMAFDENVAAIQQNVDSELTRITTGRTTAAIALGTIGQKHAERIQDVITNRDILPRLAQSTVDGKRGSTKTLVDSGAYNAAIKYSIRTRTTR